MEGSCDVAEDLLDELEEQGMSQVVDSALSASEAACEPADQVGAYRQDEAEQLVQGAASATEAPTATAGCQLDELDRPGTIPEASQLTAGASADQANLRQAKLAANPKGVLVDCAAQAVDAAPRVPQRVAPGGLGGKRKAALASGQQPAAAEAAQERTSHTVPGPSCPVVAQSQRGRAARLGLPQASATALSADTCAGTRTHIEAISEETPAGHALGSAELRLVRPGTATPAKAGKLATTPGATPGAQAKDLCGADSCGPPKRKRTAVVCYSDDELRWSWYSRRSTMSFDDWLQSLSAQERQCLGLVFVQPAGDATKAAESGLEELPKEVEPTQWADSPAVGSGEAAVAPQGRLPETGWRRGVEQAPSPPSDEPPTASATLPAARQAEVTRTTVVTSAVLGSATEGRKGLPAKGKKGQWYTEKYGAALASWKDRGDAAAAAGTTQGRPDCARSLPSGVRTPPPRPWRGSVQSAESPGKPARFATVAFAPLPCAKMPRPVSQQAQWTVLPAPVDSVLPSLT